MALSIQSKVVGSFFVGLSIGLLLSAGVSFEFYKTIEERDNLLRQIREQVRQKKLAEHHTKVCWRQLASYRGLPSSTHPDDVIAYDFKTEVDDIRNLTAIAAYDAALVAQCAQDRLQAKAPGNPSNALDFSQYKLEFVQN